jgi:hypothetical protein
MESVSDREWGHIYMIITVLELSLIFPLSLFCVEKLGRLIKSVTVLECPSCNGKDTG